jgi:hypothetical protein
MHDVIREGDSNWRHMYNHGWDGSNTEELSVIKKTHFRLIPRKLSLRIK